MSGFSGKGAIVALACIWLGACAETRESISSGIAQQVTGTSFGPKAAQTADFVTATRPTSTNYMAVGVTPPPRTLKPKSKAEVAAVESAAAAQATQAKTIGEETAAAGRRAVMSAPKPPAVD